VPMGGFDAQPRERRTAQSARSEDYQATELLSEPCSRHGCFRDLIACGETFGNLMSPPREASLVQPEQLPASSDAWSC